MSMVSSSEHITTIKPRSKLAAWYRTPLFNVILVGLISFTQPGIWNALNSTFDHQPEMEGEPNERRILVC